ncbi:MAG: hypothetical protein JNL79_21145 [Myxococcales bacterium]|nr:hypothetical protein [Myxococcales bacterium]
MRALGGAVALSLSMITLGASPAPPSAPSAPSTKPSATPSASAKPSPVCSPVPTTTLRAALDQRFVPSEPNQTLSVYTPLCAAAQGAIQEVVVELGFGHSFGRTISILSLRRAGTVWKAISLGLERAKGTKVSAWADEHTDGVRVRAFDAKASAALEAVDFASAALSVKLSVPKKPGNGLGLSGWSSSGDFYVVVKVAGTTTVERHFAGYAGSDAQLDYLPLRVAAERVLELVAPDKQPETALDASAKALFTDRLLARKDDLDRDFHWWVREAYVRAAADAGDARLLPLLVGWLSLPGGASEDRTRIAAVQAIVGLIGDDRRFGPKGAARSVGEVVKDYTAKKPKMP